MVRTAFARASPYARSPRAAASACARVTASYHARWLCMRATQQLQTRSSPQWAAGSRPCRPGQLISSRCNTMHRHIGLCSDRAFAALAISGTREPAPPKSQVLHVSGRPRRQARQPARQRCQTASSRSARQFVMRCCAATRQHDPCYCPGRAVAGALHGIEAHSLSETCEKPPELHTPPRRPQHKYPSLEAAAAEHCAAACPHVSA
jgi:hypothetical protein